MTNANDERPDADKCKDRDCFICYPLKYVELEVEGSLRIKGNGKDPAVCGL